MSAFDIPLTCPIVEMPIDDYKATTKQRGKRGTSVPRVAPVRMTPTCPLDHPDRVPPMVNNWKTAKPYQHNTAMRDALERARTVQPALVSIFNAPEE